jgi:regulator of protease activity HflC (stomatin/prohibitin superfamily)
MYIPSAVLYVVTREPYSRMWVKEATRGTSIKDEGMYLESAEGINIDFGVSTGAHIQIKDAALYLFNFGTSQVLNQGDNSDYPSVVYARPLADVMDTSVYQRIHTLLAREFGKRKFDDARLQKIECMEAAEKQAIEEFAKVGITIEYVGYASQLNFDPKIQEAINKVFIANQEAEAAESQMKAMPARLALADISIREGVGKAAEKWDGRIALPNFMLLSPGVLDAFKGLFNSPAPVVTPAAGIQK